MHQSSEMEPNHPNPHHRLGPRPLPLHLATLAMMCGSSSSALALWNSGLLRWRPNLDEAAAALANELAPVDPDVFAVAVAKAARGRLNRFMEGVQRYRALEYRRETPEPPVVWADGTIRLLDYGVAGQADRPIVLVVPSLINRAYILDLRPDSSFMRRLALRGLRPFLLDWGAPGEVERQFTLTDYVAGPLEAALEYLTDLGGKPVALVGYCMGGLLALAAAMRGPARISRLVLLATPWDFSVDPEVTRGVQLAGPSVKFWIDQLGELPVDILQTLLYGLDPLLVLRKFEAFGRRHADPARDQAFAALEDWLNDGIALAGPVAEECLFGWYSRNTTAQGRWRIAGRVVDPAKIATKTLAVIPAQDRIVPPGSALALARKLPDAEIWRPRLGHIGMMVSHAAPALWDNLAAWLSVT